MILNSQNYNTLFTFPWAQNRRAAWKQLFTEDLWSSTCPSASSLQLLVATAAFKITLVSKPVTSISAQFTNSVYSQLFAASYRPYVFPGLNVVRIQTELLARMLLSCTRPVHRLTGSPWALTQPRPNPHWGSSVNFSAQRLTLPG